MDINKILVFNIKAKAAHFKKFYSNKSSLSYRIPPRTVLMGMVASILGYSRDSYYQDLAPAKAKFAIKIISPAIPHFECMNYLKEGGGHTQVRLQLLLPKKDLIKYQIFFTHQDEKLLKELAEKIKQDKFGYGLFFGQRQFRASAQFIKVVEDVKLLKDYQGQIDTLTFKDNIQELNLKDRTKLTVDNLPASFKKVKSGREPEQIVEVCFEEEGKAINGVFNEVLKVEEKHISFFTPIVGD
ncbi:CRISPR-associated protein Cas5 [Natroniella sp. ANB-PHB2]|uniref:CRISPR-associated protein Cas5 n=1 Tax=Natroniella sp. ANB-PHB2 TaxID=3384444 RepID=UPI0038D3D89F